MTLTPRAIHEDAIREIMNHSGIDIHGSRVVEILAEYTDRKCSEAFVNAQAEAKQREEKLMCALKEKEAPVVLADHEKRLLRQRLKCNIENCFGSAFIQEREIAISSVLDAHLKTLEGALPNPLLAQMKASLNEMPKNPSLWPQGFIEKDVYAARNPADDRAIRQDRTTPAHRYAMYANFLFDAGIKHITAELLVAIDHMHTLLSDWEKS